MTDDNMTDWTPVEDVRPGDQMIGRSGDKEVSRLVVAVRVRRYERVEIVTDDPDAHPFDVEAGRRMLVRRNANTPATR